MDADYVFRAFYGLFIDLIYDPRVISVNPLQAYKPTIKNLQRLLYGLSMVFALCVRAQSITESKLRRLPHNF
jgi:hypothetical protein